MRSAHAGMAGDGRRWYAMVLDGRLMIILIIHFQDCIHIYWMTANQNRSITYIYLSVPSFASIHLEAKNDTVIYTWHKSVQ